MNIREIERITAEASLSGWYYTMPEFGKYVYSKSRTDLEVRYCPDEGTILHACTQIRDAAGVVLDSDTVAGEHDVDKLGSVLAALRRNCLATRPAPAVDNSHPRCSLELGKVN